MAIEEKVGDDFNTLLVHKEDFRTKMWNKILSRSVSNYSKYKFLENEMYRTINDRLYTKMLTLFRQDTIETKRKFIDWYFNSHEALGKSPYELCMERDHDIVIEMLEGWEYGDVQ
ncbi:MAG TPA: hypothetical protein VEC16_05485 [Alphaproteobacteria bacterium]|nr:hypothetical protein [Alphaproteobacteria bacterium]